MEYKVLNYLENDGFKQYSIILKQVNNNYDILPLFFRNLIKCLQAINYNTIPDEVVFENFLNFDFFKNISGDFLIDEVKFFLKETVSNCNSDEVWDHSEFAGNLLMYIEFVLDGTYKLN
jgi:hypothetical protein